MEWHQSEVWGDSLCPTRSTKELVCCLLWEWQVFSLLQVWGQFTDCYCQLNRSTADSFKVGSTVQYRCATGHTVKGQSLRTCELDGSWSGSPPECVCKYFYSSSWECLRERERHWVLGTWVQGAPWLVGHVSVIVSSSARNRTSLSNCYSFFSFALLLLLL